MSPEDEALIARAREQRGWTPDRKAVVAILWPMGISASKIANRIGGVSRNGVIGVVHRMGASGRGTPSVPTTAKSSIMKPPKPKAITKPNGTILKSDGMGRVGPVLEPLPIPPAGDIPATARHWLTRKPRECKWPVGDAGGYDQLSCCAPVRDEGCSYCSFHAARAFQPQQKGKRGGATELARSLRRYL